jgi:DsbC/DsbD-like thiol-disulfide interchange protein
MRLGIRYERIDSMFASALRVGFLAAMALGIGAFPAQPQVFSANTASHPISKPAPVTFLFPEQVTVPANQPTAVALHFRVAQGLHINSHTPPDPYLIPTSFSIPEGAGVHLQSASYPVGTELTLPIDPGTKLIVYSGEFVIQARIVATAGNHLIEAKLRYQACDDRACLPPRTIPVAIDVVGK